MTLTDILRTQTRETRDALERCTEKISRIGRQKNSEQTRIETIQKEIDEKNRRLQEIESEVNNIENQINDLHYKQECLGVESSNLEEELPAARKEKHNAQKNSERLAYEVQHLIKEKLRIQEKFLSEQRDALRSYLEGLEGRLADRIAGQEEVFERITSRGNLEKARHEDPKVMRLWEERSELQKLLKVAEVPTIQNRLAKQIQDIEREIDARFPGALKVQPAMGDDSKTEEIFFFSTGGGKTSVLLPVSATKWEAIEKKMDDQGSSTLRLIWAIAKALQLNAENAKIYRYRDYFTLKISKDLTASSEHPNISMPLPGSGDITFILSKLPQNIEEAVRHEG